jgi:anti-anti-sigma factor
MNTKLTNSSDDKTHLEDTAILRRLQTRILRSKIPHQIPDLSIETVSFDSPSTSGIFHQITQPAVHLVDVILGEVPGKQTSSLVLATAIKTQLLRFTSPMTASFSNNGKIRLPDEYILHPEEVLMALQDEMGELLDDLELSVSLLFCRFDLRLRFLTYVNCGHINPFHFAQNDKHGKFLSSSESLSLGLSSPNNFQPVQINYDPNDIFIFYTNDFLQLSSPDGQFFNQDHLADIIKDNAHAEVGKIAANLETSVLNFAKKRSFEAQHEIIILKMQKEELFTVSDTATKKFTSTLANLPAVRAFIANFCLQAPGDVERLSLHLQLILNEIFCNIIKYGYQNRPDEEIIIEARLGEEGIYLIISDKGEVFNTGIPSLSEEEQERFNLGLSIIKSAEQIYHVPKSHPQGWNQFHIFKRYFLEEEQKFSHLFIEKIPTFSYSIQQGVLIFRLQEDKLDTTHASFRQEFLTVIENIGVYQVVFDLSPVQYIDTAGLGILLSIRHLVISQQGKLKLVGISPALRNILVTMNMDNIFEISPTIEDALLSFAQVQS